MVSMILQDYKIHAERRGDGQINKIRLERKLEKGIQLKRFLEEKEIGRDRLKTREGRSIAPP